MSRYPQLDAYSAFSSKFARLHTIVEAMEEVEMAIVARQDRHGNEYWTEDGTEPLGMQRSNGMAALPAKIDPKPLVEEFAGSGNDFDQFLAETLAISLEQMTATLAGKERADDMADRDHRAKLFINAWEAKHGPLVADAYQHYVNEREFHASVIASAVALRKAISERQGRYQLNCNCAIEDKRREAARKQRELAEEEQRALEQELTDRAEEARKAAIAAGKAGNHAAEAEGKREEERLKAEASEVAAQPPVPAAVSTTALGERHAVAGVSGTKVYLRTIRDAVNAGVFLLWAGRRGISVSIPRDKDVRNKVILSLDGIEVTVNFSGRRKDGVQIPGVELESTVDTRNLRK